MEPMPGYDQAMTGEEMIGGAKCPTSAIRRWSRRPASNERRSGQTGSSPD
jgi:hypothetical protein